jgi:3-methyl-2-oxobutanoate hydroxymethyltransferase
MAITAADLRAMKAGGQRITMITAYDYPTAKLVDAAGVDAILVGDTLGMVVLGYGSTVPVTIEDMLHHTRAVARASTRALVVGDLPFLTYQVTPEEALRNAGALLQRGGAAAVKLEGGRAVAPTVRRIVGAGIPVMGHVGLTPQAVHQLGGFRLQAKTPPAAQALIDDALALEEAGVFALVLELVPAPLAARVSERVAMPTIGIGAGAGCDGQIQVLHDLIGLTGDPEQDHVPRHTRRFAELGRLLREATAAYVQEVREGSFPAAENGFGGSPDLRAFVEADRSQPRSTRVA